MIKIALILSIKTNILNCLPQYPKTVSGKIICIPKPPPNLSCSNIKEKYKESIIVISVPDEKIDPHQLDRDKDGIGCE